MFGFRSAMGNVVVVKKKVQRCFFFSDFHWNGTILLKINFTPKIFPEEKLKREEKDNPILWVPNFNFHFHVFLNLKGKKYTN